MRRWHGWLAMLLGALAAGMFWCWPDGPVWRGPNGMVLRFSPDSRMLHYVDLVPAVYEGPPPVVAIPGIPVPSPKRPAELWVKTVEVPSGRPVRQVQVQWDFEFLADPLLSPDGRRLLLCETMLPVKPIGPCRSALIDLERGQILSRPPTLPRSWAQFSPSGRWLVATRPTVMPPAIAPFEVSIYDSATGAPVFTAVATSQVDWPACLCFAANDQHVWLLKYDAMTQKHECVCIELPGDRCLEERSLPADYQFFKSGNDQVFLQRQRPASAPASVEFHRYDPETDRLIGRPLPTLPPLHDGGISMGDWILDGERHGAVTYQVPTEESPVDLVWADLYRWLGQKAQARSSMRAGARLYDLETGDLLADKCCRADYATLSPDLQWLACHQFSGAGPITLWRLEAHSGWLTTLVIGLGVAGATLGANRLLNSCPRRQAEGRQPSE